MPKAAIRTHMEDVTTSGYWWLSDDETEQLGGTLTFSKRAGARLELLGNFGGLHGFFQKRDRYPAVYGITTDGKEITLVDCESVNSTIGSGVPSQVLTARTTVVGSHLPDFHSLPIAKMTFRLSNLEDWLNEPGASYNMPSTGAGPFVITYSRPALSSIRIPGGSISFRFGWQSFLTRLRVAGVEEHAAIQVSRSSGFTFHEGLREFVWPFQNLLTLCTLEPSDVVELHVVPRGRRGSRTALHVYYRTSVEAPERDKPLLAMDMFLTARQLGSALPKLIHGWLAVSDTLRSVLNLHFAVMSGRWMFLESRFLNLVQAAEVFHRYTFPNYVLPKEQHRGRLKAILDHAPHEHRDWLRDALSFSNEPRLGSRLEAVIQATSSIFGWSSQEKEILMKQARDTRHYLTHYDPGAAAKAARDEKLYWLSEMLLFIVGVSLLRHAGVPDRHIGAGLERNRRLEFGKARWRQLNSTSGT